jgi:hypothetical protein
MDNNNFSGWEKFSKAMEMIGESCSEIVSDAFKTGKFSKCVSTEMTNGDVVINGDIKSLRVNGRLIRLPPEVMKGK